MDKSKIKIGKIGEDAACDYLKSNGYFILNRNFHSKAGEIDIIAVKDGCTVFVEVKTRKNDKFGLPSENVNFYKQEKIRKTAMYFLKSDMVDMRFDVIEVYHNDGIPKKINHIQNAF